MVRKRARFGAPDPSRTGTSGVAALGECVDRLDVVARSDSAVGRSSSGTGHHSRGTAGRDGASQLLRANTLVGLDRQRADLAARTSQAWGRAAEA